MDVEFENLYIKNKINEEIEKAKNIGYINIEKEIKKWDIISNIIVDWYIMKYPKKIIDLWKLEYDVDIKQHIILDSAYIPPNKLEQLSKHMSYSELMNRIPNNLHYLIECWYKNKNSNPGDEYIHGNIYSTNTLTKVSHNFKIDSRDGYLADGSYLIQGYMFGVSSGSEIETVNDLKEILDTKQYNLDELNEILQFHEIDANIRDLIFKRIAINLLISDEDVLIGYIRFKRFITEFHESLFSFNVFNLDTQDYKKWYGEFDEISQYILDQLKNESTLSQKSIDTLRLNFKTIQILKDYGINYLANLAFANIYDIETSNGIINKNIPKKDKIILNNNINLMNKYYYEEIGKSIDKNVETKIKKLKK